MRRSRREMVTLRLLILSILIHALVAPHSSRRGSITQFDASMRAYIFIIRTVFSESRDSRVAKQSRPTDSYLTEMENAKTQYGHRGYFWLFRNKRSPQPPRSSFKCYFGIIGWTIVENDLNQNWRHVNIIIKTRTTCCIRYFFKNGFIYKCRLIFKTHYLRRYLTIE